MRTVRLYILWIGIASFLLLPFATAAQAAVPKGSMHYNFTNHQMEFFDGAQWFAFNGTTLLTNSCTKEGVMDYDPLILLTYKYCDGSHWVKVIGIPTLAVCTKAGAIHFNGSTFLVCNGSLWADIKGAPAAS